MSKNYAARPFHSVDELNKKINAYFSSRKGVQALDNTGEPMFDKNGEPIMQSVDKPLTVTGLALAIGFPSRRALLDFSDKPAYNVIIQRALSVIEEYGETKLLDKGQFSGAKFFLSNNFAGWNDSAFSDSEKDSLSKLDSILEAVGGFNRKGSD